MITAFAFLSSSAVSLVPSTVLWRPPAQSGVSGGTIPPAIISPRLAPSASTVQLFNADVEVGIDSRYGATAVLLPDVLSWNNPYGLELTVFDYTGGADSYTITLTPNGADTFVQGVAPTITTAYGMVRLRPLLPGQWFVRGA